MYVYIYIYIYTHTYTHTYIHVGGPFRRPCVPAPERRLGGGRSKLGAQQAPQLTIIIILMFTTIKYQY